MIKFIFLSILLILIKHQVMAKDFKCEKACDARFYLCTSPLTDNISKVNNDYIYNNFTDDQLKTAALLRKNIKNLSTDWVILQNDTNGTLIFSTTNKEITWKLIVKKRELRSQCERIYRECRKQCSRQ